LAGAGGAAAGFWAVAGGGAGWALTGGGAAGLCPAGAGAEDAATGAAGGGALTGGAAGFAAGGAGRNAGAAGAGGTGAGGLTAGADAGLICCGTGVAGRAGGTGVGAAACCLPMMAFSTSPGFEMWERSILVLISSVPVGAGRAALAGPCPSPGPRKWVRTFSASCSSSELEWVFFSVMPISGSTSRMALLLTSSSLARSLIRILLIRLLFLRTVPLSLHINLTDCFRVARFKGSQSFSRKLECFEDP